MLSTLMNDCLCGMTLVIAVFKPYRNNEEVIEGIVKGRESDETNKSEISRTLLNNPNDPNW